MLVAFVLACLCACWLGLVSGENSHSPSSLVGGEPQTLSLYLFPVQSPLSRPSRGPSSPGLACARRPSILSPTAQCLNLARASCAPRSRGTPRLHVSRPTTQVNEGESESEIYTVAPVHLYIYIYKRRHKYIYLCVSGRERESGLF